MSGSCAVLVPVDTDDRDERIKVSELFTYADRVVVVVLLASSWELPQGTLLTYNTCTTPSLAHSLSHTHTHIQQTCTSDYLFFSRKESEVNNNESVC